MHLVFLIDCIGLILKYREQYGVPPNNPYVFGTVGKQCFLRACHLMRYYSLRCGAPNPKSLRGTELRKQIATACKMYNLPDLLVEDVANHLGHNISIHESIYRQSLGTEVPVIADILLKTMGGNIDESDNDECTNDGNVSSDKNTLAKTIITQQESPLPIPGCSFVTREFQQASSLPSPGCSPYTKIQKNVSNRQEILQVRRS